MHYIFKLIQSNYRQKIQKNILIKFYKYFYKSIIFLCIVLMLTKGVVVERFTLTLKKQLDKANTPRKLSSEKFKLKTVLE